MTPADWKQFRPSNPVALAAVVLGVMFLASDRVGWKWLFHSWSTSPDNSHGMLVPIYSLWLLWHRRDTVTPSAKPFSWWAFALGGVLIVAGAGIRTAGIYTRTITMEAVSIIPTVAGIAFACGGWTFVRWAWPSILFLGFMIPLPGPLGDLLNELLQRIATVSSTYLLQTIGIPAIHKGNVIWLTHHQLGVAEACSGIRMLMTFIALSVGVAFVMERPFWEKCVVVLSAPLVAVLSNVLRITATSLAYEFGNERIADAIFHDLAGWLMMPVGLLILGIELLLISRIFQVVDLSEA